MLFGAATGTVLGKALGGYADGREDAFDRASRPMARFQLEEPTKDGDDSLTLEVTQAQYAQLMPGQSGKLSWWGRKLSDFVVMDEPDEAIEEKLPQAEVAEPLPEPMQVSESVQQPEEPPVVQPCLESALPTVDVTEISPLTIPAKNKTEMNCPWCGKAMDIWRMAGGQYGNVMKRGAQWRFDKEKLKRFLFSPSLDEEDRVELPSGTLLLHVCVNCQKAIIDYKNGACDGSIWA